MQLFLRKGNTISLTKEGQHLIAYLAPSFDKIKLAIHTFPKKQKKIILGASFGIMHLWMMPRLTTLRGATSITVNFYTGKSYADLEQAGIDASIQFSNGAMKPTIQIFYLKRRVIFLPRQNFLKNIQKLTPTAYRKHFTLNGY